MPGRWAESRRWREGILGSSNVGRLGVGVIGLGRLWEARHKPALKRLGDILKIVAVYDQVQRRSEIEASHLGCRAAEGLRELIDDPQVDVIHLLSAQWFGLFPIELACLAKKPVYCGIPLSGDLEALIPVTRQVLDSGIPFMPEFARRFYPATLRLREILATRLGKPRLIVGHSRFFSFNRYGEPGPATQIAPAPLLIDPGGYLLDWCSFLFQAELISLEGNSTRILPEPEGESARTDAGPDFESFTARFEGGGVAQISYGRYHRANWGEASKFLPTPGFQVFTEKGAAWLELPERIQWSDSEGNHEERIPLEPTVGEVLNRQFHQLAIGAPSFAPTVEDALANAWRVAELRQSQAEGRTIRCASGG